MNNPSFLKVRTPAKLILSGEHAVIYGHPALAIAVNRYTEVIARWTTPLQFSFQLLGIDFREVITLETLKRLKHKLDKQYAHFISGKINIREVIKQPFELTLYTAINVLDKIKRKLPMGIDITTQSNIPIGCGMGSSAANVVSVIFALSQLLKMPFNISDYIRLGTESENLQHGHSSGLDVEVVYHGGCLHYQQGQISSRPLPTIPMVLVQTGKPDSSTGECVAHAKHFFTQKKIGREFAAVTQALDNALQNNDIEGVKASIRCNHKLLNAIDVIPEKANQFISQLETMGAAAKVCGAGSVHGDKAGVILVIGDKDITPLAQKFRYRLLPIHSEQRGTHVI